MKGWEEIKEVEKDTNERQKKSEEESVQLNLLCCLEDGVTNWPCGTVGDRGVIVGGTPLRGQDGSTLPQCVNTVSSTGFPRPGSRGFWAYHL